jgi:hypothetical protein
MTSQQKHRIFRRGGLAISGLAALILLAAYVPPLMDWLTVGDDEIGEAYRSVQVDHFQERIPPAPPPLPDAETVGVADARIYTIGDSFTWLRLGYHDFTTQLQLAAGEPAVYIGHSGWANPFYDLKYENVDTSVKRVLVYQKIESYALASYTRPYNVDPPPRKGGRLLGKYAEPVRAGLNWSFVEVEDRLQYLLEYNHLAFALTSWYHTWRYNRTGDLDDWAGMTLGNEQVFKKYSVSAESWHGSISSLAPISDAQIDAAVENLVTVRRQLLDRYNTELLLLLVPNKVTTFADEMGLSYNNLIPRLEAKLDAAGIPYVSIYDDFLGNGRAMYYTSDPHWNSTGREVAVQKVTAKIDALLNE